MKKLLTSAVIVIIIFLCYFAGKFVADVLDLHLYIGWKDAQINNHITVKVPKHWEQKEKYGLTYFYDTKLRDVVLFESEAEELMMLYDVISDEEDIERNVISENFQNIVHTNGSVNSLGVTHGDAIVAVEAITYSESYIYYGDMDNEITFYSWNRNVDDKIIEKIADSFQIN